MSTDAPELSHGSDASVAGFTRRPTLGSYYLGWMLVLVATVATVLVIRDTGRRWIAQADARVALADGIQRFREGDLTEGQRIIARQLIAEPKLWPEVVDALDTAILGLPLIHRQLNAHIEDIESPAAFKARLILAPETLPSATDEDTSGQRQLWLGRAAFHAGQFHDANKAFQRHWNDQGPRKRAAQFSKILPETPEATSPHRTEETGHLLLGYGLWQEAFNLCAGRANENPGLAFFDALQAEINNDPQAAIKAYTTLLKARPHHRLASIRLQELNP